MAGPRRSTSKVLSQILCCFGPAPVSLPCTCLPAIKAPTSTKLMYALLFSFNVAASCFALYANVQTYLTLHIPHLAIECSRLSVNAPCKLLSGYFVVYRVTQVTVCFHTLMMIATYHLSDRSSFQFDLHNGFWGLKFLLTSGTCLCTFYIPKSETFTLIWMNLGRVGGFAFIIIQMLVLVDKSFQLDFILRLKLSKRSRATKLKCLAALYTFDISILFLTAGFWLVLYAFYTKPNACHENKLFLTCILVLLLVVVLFSVLPRFKETNSFMQGVLVAFYLVFETLQAFNSEPPTIDQRNSTEISEKYLFIETNNATDKLVYCSPELSYEYVSRGDAVWEIIRKYLGEALIVLFAVATTMDISTAGERVGISPTRKPKIVKDYKFQRNVPDVHISTASPEISTRKGQTVTDDEDRLTYNYCFFHFIFALAAFSFMMQLTIWDNPQKAATTQSGLNWTSVYVKMLSVLVCFIFYLVNVTCPIFLPGRKRFYEDVHTLTKSFSNEATSLQANKA